MPESGRFLIMNSMALASRFKMLTVICLTDIPPDWICETVWEPSCDNGMAAAPETNLLCVFDNEIGPVLPGERVK